MNNNNICLLKFLMKKFNNINIISYVVLLKYENILFDIERNNYKTIYCII